MKRLACLVPIVCLCGIGLWLMRTRDSAASISHRAPSVSPERNSFRSVASTQVRSAQSSKGRREPAPPVPGASSHPPPDESPKQRPWDTKYLANLGAIAEGEATQFELVEGRMAVGTICHVRREKGEIVFISGQISDPEIGRFFFQRQTEKGVAGDFVGVVELPGSGVAYRVEPSDRGGAQALVERPSRKVLCLRLPRPEGNRALSVEKIPPLRPDDAVEGSIPEYQNGIIPLESLYGSPQVIYLDFQGGSTDTWGGIDYARPIMSNADIRDTWRRVAEDYMPFNINVVTDLGVFQRAPENSRQRVIITPTDTAGPDSGGISYVRCPAFIRQLHLLSFLE